MSIPTPTQTPTQTIHRHRLGAFGRAWLSAVKSPVLSFYQGPWPMAPGSQILSFYEDPWPITARGFSGARKSVEAGVGGGRGRSYDQGRADSAWLCLLVLHAKWPEAPALGLCFVLPHAKRTRGGPFLFYERPRRTPASLEVRRRRCGSKPRGGRVVGCGLNFWYFYYFRSFLKKYKPWA